MRQGKTDRRAARSFVRNWRNRLRGVFNRAAIAALVIAAAALSAGGPGLAAPLDAAIKARVEALSGGSAKGPVEIAAVDFITAFYAARQYRPAWYGTPSGEQLFREIADSPQHGFRPVDFHAGALPKLRAAAESGDAAAVAEFDIVATDAAIRLLHHLYFGKVSPERLDPDWNFERPVVGGDPAVTVGEFVDAGTFSLLVDDIELKHPQYREMQAALGRYREIEAAGGWPEIPAGGPLKPGMQDPRVPALRARLAATGDLQGTAGTGDSYDPVLEAALKRFQARHGLEDDGVVGPRSLEALNRPVGARIDQLRLSMERARWILRGLQGDFVLVNIGGATTYLARGGKVVWRTRSIVGQQFRKTPVFRDEIKYMEINPTWTVPVSILRRDKLPKIRRDIGYLKRSNFVVRDRNGQQVNPRSVNWSARNPGVTLVQQPGPKNALGLVKFMFPNKYSVYLHDTDNRSLFSRAGRNLSSGCVRIENPFVFADLIMEGAPDWNAERREAILASGKTTRVDLPKPLPVLLTYYTAWIEDGQVQFRRDVYERDGKLLSALNGAFRR